IFRLIGAGRAEAIPRARSQARNVAVPDLVGVLLERQPRLMKAGKIAQAQLHRLRRLAEHGKVHPRPVHVAPSGYGAPGRTPRLAGSRWAESARVGWAASVTLG